MTIYFNPYYDSSVFLTDEDCGLGKLFSGKEALLGELELRAGLTCAEIDHSERVIAYMEAMKTALDRAEAEGRDLYYAESFGRDDFGTAELMLGWRDSLVKAGWDGTSGVTSEKIEVLSLIESAFDCPGPADRWRTILKEAEIRPILRPSDRIVVQCREEDLEPSIKHLFESIQKHYSDRIVEYHSRTDGQSLASRCRILEFENEYDAHEWIASQDLAGNDVVAEADEALLNDILHVLGKPGIGAADEGIGAIMRLLPLGMALFRHPADITCLQSYLQSPRTPLGKLHTQLGRKDGSPYWVRTASLLYGHICSEGGFGKKWRDIIGEAKFQWDGTPLDDRTYQDALLFIDMWDRSRDLPAGEARVADVTAFVKGLGRWAGSSIQPECSLNPQFQALQRYCGTMLRLISSVDTETVSVDKLCTWANHICVPINISSDYARLGSINTVSNVADIYSGAEKLIWFAAATDNGISYEYDFLSRSEIKALSGVWIADKEQTARMDKAYRLEGMCRCKDITIVTCRRISGVDTVQSSLLSDISRVIPSKPGDAVVKTGKGTVSTDFGKKAEHRFDPSVLDGFRRDAESYSSISTLIMSPVDYLLDYVKGYRQYGIDEVADLPTTEGTVAHAYIEKLGERCSNDPMAMLSLHNSGYDAILDEVISDNGLVLCLEENSLEEKSFRISLKESVSTLLGIIIGNGLKIIGFEYETTQCIEPIGPVYAKIDCLLQDPADGEYVIIDFKYNGGKTYKDKIEKNRELQLAVYRKVVENDPDLGKVKFIGYYAIPRRTLFTPQNTLRDNPAIEEVIQPATTDIFSLAAKGYQFRMEQLRKGILEEGEGLKIEDLDYSSQVGLYALDADYEDPSIKAGAYGDKNIVLKGGLE